MAKQTHFDVVIIGAGQCGVALGYYLKQFKIHYIILEKHQAFSAWYRRWQSFKMNTSNWMNCLPSCEDSLLKSDYYKLQNKDQIINSFENWRYTFKPNICIATVNNVCKDNNGFKLLTDNKVYYSESIIFAVGLNQIFIPKLSCLIDSTIHHFHSSEYINAQQIKTSSVLIVGSGSSGVQICHDLALQKKFKLYLSCSNNTTFPNKIFGISIYRIIKIFNIFKIPSSSLIGQVVQYYAKNSGDPATQPSPKNLQSKLQVNLFGKFQTVTHNYAKFSYGPEILLADITIIWCTGFRLNLNSIISKDLQKLLLKNNGYPIRKTSFESFIPNIYFIGLRFQRLLSSHTVYGAIRDAKALAYLLKNKFKR